jgi:Bacterial extracellular solute-binding proteins, family 5 Middle
MSNKKILTSGCLWFLIGCMNFHRGNDLQANWKETIKDWQYQVYKFWNIVWPINWSNIKNYHLVINTLESTTNFIKGILAICVVGSLLSTIFLLQGFYIVLTVESASQGGEFNEAVYSQTFSVINPLLSANNDTDRKVSSLIYHPLFRVVYPDFLNSEEVPKIEPILLKNEPELIDRDGEKIIKLELKDNLKWSDGSAITSEDVTYSFERLKETNGNSDFRDVFANYKIVAINQKEMEISLINKNRSFNLQLKYLLNFSPVSKKYFEDKSLDDVIRNTKVIQNQVVSGYYIIPPKVKVDGKENNNPVQSINGSFNSIVLEKNLENTYKPALIQRYILRIYPDLIDTGGVQNTSLERASVTNKVDLFNRFLNFNSSINPDYIKEKFKLQQKIVPTNTYYTMYANTQAGQWLINSNLRKYIFCNLENFELDKNNWAIESIPVERRVVPIQLGKYTKYDSTKCINSLPELLSQKNKNGRNTYAQVGNEIQLDSKAVNINILTLEDMVGMTKQIQSKLDLAGIKSYLTLAKDSDELEQKIAGREYNLIFLPTTIISKDIYPMFGSKARNISSLNKNNRIGNESEKFGEGVEKLIKDYSDSYAQDINMRQKLSDLFANEYISLNLFRARNEINYSARVRLSGSNFDSIFTFGQDAYNQISSWYVSTKRKFRWM